MKKQLNGNFLFLFFLLLFEIFFSLVMKKHCKLIRIFHMLGMAKELHSIIKENMKKQLNGNFLFLFFLLLFEIFFSLVMKKHCKLIRIA